jgi:hypothetical protein
MEVKNKISRNLPVSVFLYKNTRHNLLAQSRTCKIKRTLKQNAGPGTVFTPPPKIIFIQFILIPSIH